MKGLEPVYALELQDGSYGPATAAVVASLLQVLQPDVSKLYFDRNPLTSAGGVALAEMLRHNCELAELHLRFTGMGAAGAAALAEALERNTAVQKVYLIQNAVGADGAAALARMMRVNSTVRPRRDGK